MDRNNTKMDFKAYYEKLKRQHTNLRDEICETLGISLETFYQKIKKDSFDYPQKVVIAQIIGESIEILFPEKEVA